MFFLFLLFFSRFSHLWFKSGTLPPAKNISKMRAAFLAAGVHGPPQPVIAVDPLPPVFDAPSVLASVGGVLAGFGYDVASLPPPIPAHPALSPPLVPSAPSPPPPPKRVRWSATLDDSGFCCNQADTSPARRAGVSTSPPSALEESISTWFQDKVWMKKDKVDNVVSAFEQLKLQLSRVGAWDQVLADMSEEVRFTVDSLLERSGGPAGH